MTPTDTSGKQKTWRDWLPDRLWVDAQERMRACVGALLGILVTVLIGRWVVDASPAFPWLIAPMGASAVLLFAVPSSPLAQPWSIIGGNLIAALVGVACWKLFSDPVMASAIAIALTIGGMFLLRCIHPPSGAVALTAVLGGPAVHALGFGFVLDPVMLNSFCILAVAIAYNRVTGRDYPHRKSASPLATDATPARQIGVTGADLDEVLRNYNEVLDVSRDDLESLLTQVEAVAYRRRHGEVDCADIMTREVISVDFATTLEDAWTLMQTRGIKALPVIDRARRVIGIVTRADFMRLADLSVYPGFGERLKTMIRRSRSTHSERPEVVGQIMSSPAQTATADTHITELVPLLGGGGHSHIPIIDEERRLVGIVAPRDLITALYQRRLSAAG